MPNEVDETKSFHIMKPEVDCKRTWDFFERSGVNSYLELVNEFELPYDTLL